MQLDSAASWGAAAVAWPADRVTFTVVLGVAAADTDHGSEQIVGGGPAAGASLGVELRRRRSFALFLTAAAYGGEFDDARAIHVGLTLGMAWYGLTNPPPGT